MSETFPDEVKALNAALAEAQGEFPAIGREKSVTVTTKTGGSYSFAYAPLEVILAAVRPALTGHGLAVVQRLESPGGVPSLRTELRHAEGAVIAASFPLGEVPASPQALGSLLTYLRRYALVAMLGIATEEDDDGAHAAGHISQPAAEPPADEGGYTGEASPFQPPPQLFEGGDANLLSEAQRKKIFALRSKLLNAGKLTEENWSQTLGAEYGTESVRELTKAQASHLIDRMVGIEATIE